MKEIIENEEERLIYNQVVNRDIIWGGWNKIYGGRGYPLHLWGYNLSCEGSNQALQRRNNNQNTRKHPIAKLEP